MKKSKQENISPDHDSGQSPEESADEQYLHGLLRTMSDRPEDASNRTRRVMESIGRDGSRMKAPHRFPMLLRVATGLAAMLLLGMAIFFMNETRQSAWATIAETISATQSAGDRSYRLSFTDREGGRFKTRPHATLDVRSDDQYVFMDKTPEGHMLIAGADARGQWMISRQGSVLRNTGRKQPSWVDIGGNSLLMASIDGMLETLQADYALESLEPEALDQLVPTRCIRIRAMKLEETDSGPERIDLWIDPENRLVRRMEVVLGDTPFNDRMREHPTPPRDGRRHHRPSQHAGGPPKHHRDGDIGRKPPHPPRRPHLPGGPRGGHKLHAVRFDLDSRTNLSPEWFTPEVHSTRR
jgi:hypothetical protein